MTIDDTIKTLEAAVPAEAKAPRWLPIKNTTELAALPDFPLDSLPQVLRNMADGISRSRKVPVAMAATSLLTAVGMAIGRNIYYRRKRGFEGRANLYALIFAARGERKSASFKPALEPFYKWMADRDSAYRRELKEYNRTQMLMKNIEESLSKPSLSSSRKAELKQEYDMLEYNLGDAPRNPWFMLDDTTPEAVSKLMIETGGSAGIFSDDARLIVKVMLGNVYSNSGEGREDFLLRPFDGEQPLVRRRVGSGSEFIERPCIGMLLMLQTDFLSKIGSSASFFSSGLASRCLFCYPESWVGRRSEDGKLLRSDDGYEISAIVEEEYRMLIFRLLDRAYRSSKEEYYGLSPEAAALWQEFYHEIESESGPDGIYGKMQDIAIRYPTMALRLSLLLAVVSGALEIKQVHVRNALEIMRYYMASAQRCCDAMQRGNGLSEISRKIISIWSRSYSEKMRIFSIRELQNTLHLLKGDVVNALEELIGYNYCRYLVSEKTVRPVGRPGSPQLEINPMFFE
ncbi:MAG: DUF3987 domain-containing protein [Lentisphaeria bacterium]|nr:DUF3987 domain-containing protein [Lentisphaeria bacterium]